MQFVRDKVGCVGIGIVLAYVGDAVRAGTVVWIVLYVGVGALL